MENKIDFLTKQLVEQAAKAINETGIPKNREWSQYVVEVDGAKYPFKLIVTEAAKINGLSLSHKDFASGDYYRKAFEKLTSYKCVDELVGVNDNPMDKDKLLKCISFFNDLTVEEKVVPAVNQHQRTVVVTYTYQGKSYKTKQLHYSSIAGDDRIDKKNEVLDYFGGRVYWLNINKHNWPEGSGAEIENRVIKDMLNGENAEFEVLLKKIANNQKTGFLQEITADGRSQQYGFNLTNNNHWHDLIKLVKYIINTKGEMPPKEYFSPLVFKWLNQTRQSLSPQFGNRAIINNLLKNISSLESELTQMDSINVLLNKKQIILQGPPGTGKTYTAKDMAEQIIHGSISEDKQEQKKRLDESGQFKLVQFHPSYSYEDFVRGITAKSEDGGIVYETENKTLALFADIAQQNVLSTSAKADKSALNKYVLIIDEINRANLPSVLGELIYALEYRDESVETMYAFEGNRNIVIPSNLYIIGTMNTADRSVGHIDYAIKRRFAFVDVLPNEAVIRNEKAKELFEIVAKLFAKEENGELSNSIFLASDFDYKDVQLGHSYFILKNGSIEEQKKELEMRLQYEIIPILDEYVKDGLLLETAKTEIKKIAQFEC